VQSSSITHELIGVDLQSMKILFEFAILLDSSGAFTPPVLCTIFGGVLLAVAIIGGGLRVKEIEIPQMNLWARTLAGVIGCALLVYGLGIFGSQNLMNNGANTRPSVAQNVESQATVKTDDRNLVPIKCDVSYSLRSGDSSQKTSVLFFNESQRLVNIFWINHEGQKEFWFTLQPKNTPNDHSRVETYEGHPWLIQNEQGQCLEVFLSTAEDSVARIDKSTP
jgi:VHL beta domain